jgi:hypothetical protein
MDIKTIVKDNTVHFAKYRKGLAYYAVKVPPEGVEYLFPVPLEDVGDATLLATEKALLFMRYIRKAINEGTFQRSAGPADP